MSHYVVMEAETASSENMNRNVSQVSYSVAARIFMQLFFFKAYILIILCVLLNCVRKSKVTTKVHDSDIKVKL